MFPFINYGDTRAALLADVVTVYTLGCRLLKRGATGADVKTLLGLLNQLGAGTSQPVRRILGGRWHLQC